MKYLQNERLLILGLGISGLSMARWCVRCGAAVRVADTRANPPGLQALQDAALQVEFFGGPLDAQELLAPLNGEPLTRVLKSPGLAPTDEQVKAVLEAAQARGIVASGELDMFSEAVAAIDAQVCAKQQRAWDEEQERLAQEALAAIEPVGEDDAGTVVSLVPDEGDVLERDSVEEALAEDILPENLLVEKLPTPVFIPQGYKPRIIAVTGTNGKTTVTSLTAQLVERTGKTVVAAGNIGPALLDTLAKKLDEDALPDVWVLELSSFQLDIAHQFDPAAATILNITQDHLDWHGDMQAYVAAKARVFGPDTVRILNRDDAQVMAFRPEDEMLEAMPAKRQRGKSKKTKRVPVVTFGLDMPTVPGDFGLVDDSGMMWLAQAMPTDETLIEAPAVTCQRLIPANALRIHGRHNTANALAALALATAAGCPMGPMLFGLREYRGEPHRVESVAIVNGVEYIDDSKGTNVGATAAALSGLGSERQLVVILGGDGKGQDFSPLVPLVRQYVRAVVLIGHDALLIEAALQDCGVTMLHAATMDEAVRAAALQALSGDAVLLSPACASLDMFDNYAERAKAFVQSVYNLGEDQGQVMGGV